jgi:hypothetical protein
MTLAAGYREISPQGCSKCADITGDVHKPDILLWTSHTRALLRVGPCIDWRTVATSDIDALGKWMRFSFADTTVGPAVGSGKRNSPETARQCPLGVSQMHPQYRNGP